MPEDPERARAGYVAGRPARRRPLSRGSPGVRAGRRRRRARVDADRAPLRARRDAVPHRRRQALAAASLAAQAAARADRSRGGGRGGKPRRPRGGGGRGVGALSRHDPRERQELGPGGRRSFPPLAVARAGEGSRRGARRGPPGSRRPGLRHASALGAAGKVEAARRCGQRGSRSGVRTAAGARRPDRERVARRDRSRVSASVPAARGFRRIRPHGGRDDLRRAHPAGWKDRRVLQGSRSRLRFRAGVLLRARHRLHLQAEGGDEGLVPRRGRRLRALPVSDDRRGAAISDERGAMVRPEPPGTGLSRGRRAEGRPPRGLPGGAGSPDRQAARAPARGRGDSGRIGARLHASSPFAPRTRARRRPTSRITTTGFRSGSKAAPWRS